MSDPVTGGTLAPLDEQLANSTDYWLGWGQHWHLDGMDLVRSGIDHPIINGVLRYGGEDLDAALAVARERLQGVPWMWWVAPDSRPGLAEDLVARGAEKAGGLAVMAISTGRSRPSASLPDGLEVSEVDPASGLQQWVAAFAPSFEIAAEDVAACVAAESARPAAPQDVVRLAGTVDGEVVATSMVLLSGRIAGLYVIATDETHRSRGIGRAMTEAALRAAHERGASTATLQATEMGEPLYRSMGFETVARYDQYKL